MVGYTIGSIGKIEYQDFGLGESGVNRNRDRTSLFLASEVCAMYRAVVK